MTKLKPCPLCGAPAVIRTGKTAVRVRCTRGRGDYIYHIVETVGFSEEEAVKMWNERTM